MAKLKTLYDTPEDIPEGYAELFAERNGKMEFVGVEGVKTQADIDRVQTALSKERADHREAKAQLARFSGIDPETVQEKLDEADNVKAQLEAFTKDGKLDETKLEPIIEARLKAKLGPLDREKQGLARSLDEQKKLTADAVSKAELLQGTLKRGQVERAIRDAALAQKLVPTAIEDAVTTGMTMLDVADDGAIVTKDIQGITPGIGPGDWLKDMQDKRPHWWPSSQGGGAQGGKGSIPNRADNPWTKEGWNVTRQGQMMKADPAKGEAAMKAAGSHVGATAPAQAQK